MVKFIMNLLGYQTAQQKKKAELCDKIKVLQTHIAFVPEIPEKEFLLITAILSEVWAQLYLDL